MKSVLKIYSLKLTTLFFIVLVNPTVQSIQLYSSRVLLMVLLVHFGVLLGPERGIAYNKILFGALLIYTVRFQFHCHCKFNCIIAEFFNGSYQSIFGSYQALLGACACKSCLLGVYSYRLSTFIFIVMADSASISFLTRRHARTHAHQENPLIEVGRAHLKMTKQYWLLNIWDLSNQ